MRITLHLHRTKCIQCKNSSRLFNQAKGEDTWIIIRKHRDVLSAQFRTIRHNELIHKFWYHKAVTVQYECLTLAKYSSLVLLVMENQVLTTNQLSRCFINDSLCIKLFVRSAKRLTFRLCFIWCLPLLSLSKYSKWQISCKLFQNKTFCSFTVVWTPFEFHHIHVSGLKQTYVSL